MKECKYKADELEFCPYCNIGINIRERDMRVCQNCHSHWDDDGEVFDDNEEEFSPPYK